MAPRVLFIFSSAGTSLLGKPTGWYLPEAAHPYYILAPHAEIDFAAPKGPNPPVDPDSVAGWKDSESVAFLSDAVVQAKFAAAKTLDQVRVADYDAVFYPGGLGPVLDLASDPVNATLASEFWQAGKIVSAVCHGPAALVGAVDKAGVPVLKGKTVAGFTNDEEAALGTLEAVPFLLEDRLKELGAHQVKGALWAPVFEVDGKLITGQNPASATPVGEALLKALQGN